MKTRKSIRVTSIIQIIYSVYCLVALLFVVIGTTIGPVLLANSVLFVFFPIAYKLAIIIPACLIVNLSCFFSDRKIPEQRELVGKRWIWIIVCAVMSAASFVALCLPFVRW